MAAVSNATVEADANRFLLVVTILGVVEPWLFPEQEGLDNDRLDAAII